MVRFPNDYRQYTYVELIALDDGRLKAIIVPGLYNLHGDENTPTKEADGRISIHSIKSNTREWIDGRLPVYLIDEAVELTAQLF